MTITLVLRDSEYPLWSDYSSAEGVLFRDTLRLEALDLGEIFGASHIEIAYRELTLATIEVTPQCEL